MSSFFRTAAALGASLVLIGTLSACASNSGADTEAGAAGEGSVQTIKVATAAEPRPYTYLGDDNVITGYDIELVRLIDEKLEDYEFEFEVTDFQGIFAGLDSGRFNMVANNLSATEERKEKYEFSTPYIEAQFGIITDADSPLTTSTTFDDLGGLSTYGTPGLNFTKMLEAYNEQNPDNPIDIQYTDLDLQSQYNNLATGQIDFTFAEQVVYGGYASRHENLVFTPLDQQYLVDEFGTNLHSAFAISRQTENYEELVTAIDGAITELIADGTLTELSKEFFDGVDVTEGLR